MKKEEKIDNYWDSLSKHPGRTIFITLIFAEVFKVAIECIFGSEKDN